MTDVTFAIGLLGALVAGGVLGVVFFWGLWLTVRGLDRTSHPTARVLVSLVLRFGLVLTAFYVLARHAGWPHVLAAAVGLTIARFGLAHQKRTRRSAKGAQS